MHVAGTVVSAGAAFSRPTASEHAAFYSPYIARVPDGDVLDHLARQIDDTRRALRDLPAERSGHRYAPDKWSVTEVVGHLADAERVFAYRALRFARGDATPLPGFDETVYTPAGEFDRRPMAALVDEFGVVRAATLALFRGLPADAATRTGVANGQPISVRALAWIIAGHELHHRAVLRERYGVG